MEIISGFGIPLWIILLVVLLFLLYRYSTSTFGTFKELNIPGPKPWPFVGTMLGFFRQGLFEFDKELHKKYGKVVGTFLGKRPEILIFDVEILKQILVKDFGHFKNRYTIAVNQFPLDKMLTVLVDDHWKYVRSHMSPTFSGKKLRLMMSQINRCAEMLLGNLETAIKAGDVFECKEHAASFTMDVIASTAFGLDINSQLDKNSRFLLMAQKIFGLEKFSFKAMLFLLFPGLAKYFSKVGLSILDKEATDFFVSIIDKSIKDREENSEESPKDFLQLMLSARLDEEQEAELLKDKTGDDKSDIWTRKGLTREEIFAQSLLFFLGGYETSSVAISFAMYNLAVEPECQEKLYKEICDVLGQDEVNYDNMKQMKYLEMCVEETLRMFPPGARTNRVASEDVEIDGIRIPKGMSIGISTYALQHDPDVWPEPDKFDPERFTPEAKQDRHQFYYMPFGMGPRNCVAQRLGMLQVKVALVHIVRKFKLVTCEKTQIPVRLQKIRMRAEKGLWLKAELRE